jgi:aminoglycoside phosphotransferase (APT) family kinase protein
MATLGDPLMDLGTALAYWVDASDSELMKTQAFGRTMLPGSLSRKELATRYADRSGVELTDTLFYYCFGMFKLAVIVQQIYARYVRGHTADRRFAKLNQTVAALARAAVVAKDTGDY